MARASRVSRGPGSGGVELPPYQTPTHALTASAQRSLQNLSTVHPLRKVRAHVAAANGAITEMAGEINDRLVQGEGHLQRRRARLLPRKTGGVAAAAAGADDDEEADVDADTAALEEKVARMKDEVVRLTAQMEASTRSLIDVDARAVAMEDVLRELANSRHHHHHHHPPPASQASLDAENSQVLRPGPAQRFRNDLSQRRTEFEKQSQRQK